jgi:hypothetical protein
MAPVMAECMSESVEAITRAGERGGVHLVVGMQDQRHVEGAGSLLVGLLAESMYR